MPVLFFLRLTDEDGITAGEKTDAASVCLVHRVLRNGHDSVALTKKIHVNVQEDVPAIDVDADSGELTGDVMECKRKRAHNLLDSSVIKKVRESVSDKGSAESGREDELDSMQEGEVDGAKQAQPTADTIPLQAHAVGFTPDKIKQHFYNLDSDISRMEVDFCAHKKYLSREVDELKRDIQVKDVEIEGLKADAVVVKKELGSVKKELSGVVQELSRVVQWIGRVKQS